MYKQNDKISYDFIKLWRMITNWARKSAISECTEAKRNDNLNCYEILN